MPKYPDAAASRAYYAAFSAVSAWLTRQGKSLSKHSAVESAVHRDLVHAGLWPAGLGADYSRLRQARDVGDYAVMMHVTSDQAYESIDVAARIIEAVHKLAPDDFPWPSDT
ncbi:MAG: HEPN domain-containing protein [Thermodesulfobacteriota bacterium]